MKKQIQDERIIQEARKQNSLGFTILYFGILVILLYRQFILQEPISRYWDLSLLFFGVTFFMAAKRMSAGLLIRKPNLKSIVPSSIASTVVFSIVNYWWLGKTSPVEVLIEGITFFVVFTAVILLMYYISYKKNDEMLK
ncbi:MAG: hypothetical protein PWQ97_1127 [Tepidanaerobacteraceae bacterium]|nr:hypothetical protein [Tepidanaerobacteraceae bacterium]